ncbi:DUF1703-domain-containing protein [Gigaspora margarita]|uniref:DUF1703-domain-containing protein n=1 Tax=Gigaspora margarita TaxID=4874 RepID=A0A8H4EGU6_GIGMA|nr:DUF1703-domain-containing protein [Gigaspora margarita]
MEYMSKGDHLKLKYPGGHTDYWDRDPSAWRKLNDWDIYWIGNQPPSSSITKQNSHFALADELRCLREIYANTHPAYKSIKNLQKEMKESIIIEIIYVRKKKGIQCGLQIARRGFQLYSDMEFDSVERERKRLKADGPQSQSIDNSEMLPVKANLVSASSKPLKILSTGSFADLKQEGGYYLDKTHFITKIEYLNARAIFSLRPRHFGKTLFLSTLSSYYDVKNKGKKFEQLFGDLYIRKNPAPLASSFLFERRYDKVLCRYRQELKDYHQILDKKESALVNFKELLNAVELSEHKLYVFIDEYDAGMTEALKNEYTLQLLIAHHKNSPSRTEVIESSFKQFYSRLKSACDDGLVYVFQTGVTPIVMAEFTSGFNISEDLPLTKNFGTYNSWNSLITHDALLDFPSDPQTLPSQISLDLIVNNPLGKSILTEALARHPLESKDVLAQRFRLTNIRELATDRASLLSFMFYIRAITYQPSLLTKHYFRIPNHLTEKKFIREALKIYDWKEDDLIPVRDNSIVYSNEEALKQAFMDAMILTLHADIEPEFQVYSQSPDLYGMAIDLVKTNMGKRIAIEFDNIQMKKVLLDEASGHWQDATKVSRSLLEKSEEEILGLKIDDEHRKGQKTIVEALEYKINTKKKYLGPLSKRNDTDLKSMFIVLRVVTHTFSFSHIHPFYDGISCVSRIVSFGYPLPVFQQLEQKNILRRVIKSSGPDLAT